MEPQFRFCTSADGTRIAYAIYGSGPPLLYANTYVLSMDAQFTLPEARAYFDALAAHTTLVIFDRRGAGASARDVDDLSPEAEARDIAAVADAAELRDFTLFADATSSPPCAHYAIEHQERVLRLILWFPLIVGGSAWDREQARSFREDWTYARRVWAGVVYPEGPVSLQRALSKAIKDTLSAEMAARRFELEVDVDALLPTVTASALVLHRETKVRRVALHAARLLPNGQLRFVSGDATTPFPGHEAIVEAVVEFMGLNEPAAAQHEETSAFRTILFTDLADSTSLTQRLGDAKAQDLLRAHNAIVREALAAQGGNEIKHTGDGIMASFASASGALECAVAIQRNMEQGTRNMALPHPISVHIGLNAGEPVAEDNDLFGTAVQLARRICDQASAGEIFASNVVRELVAGKGFLFADRGETALRGFEDPVRLFEVRWQPA